jgi:DNA-binding response OmpR family regulator
MQDREGERDLILVADDEPNIVELVALFLRRHGYRVATAFDGDETLQKVRELDPSLLVLDVMMPGQDGFQVLRQLRRKGGLPVIMLTARTSDVDKISGLSLGADDYVTKPFNPEELVARVTAVLRRTRNGAAPPRDEALRAGRLTVDMASREACVGNQPVAMTPREFDLLATLLRFQGMALDREQLLDLVWGTAFYAPRTVDVHVARLREKLKGSGVKIETVWGSGYRLQQEPGP